MEKLVEWVKQHKGLAIAISGGLLILLYLYYSSQSAAQANSAAAAQAASGMPDDTILSQEIAAQATLQQEQIAAQAQTSQYQYAAQVDLATVQGQASASNAQNQAALTLGLAQAGDSTSSILQLIGAQPGVTTTTSATGNSTTSPTATATLTGATAAGGTGTNAQPVAVPITTMPVPITPAGAAIANSNIIVNPATMATDPNTSNEVMQTEADVYGTTAASTGDVEYAVWSTPAMRANFADLRGMHAIVSSSVVSGSGGPFYNAPGEDVVSENGIVGAGQIVSEVANANPAQWTAILANHGIQNTASVHSGLVNMFGPNQVLPETDGGAL
jgi:hypothetical protein